jgi:hypothetical protein
LTHVEVISLPSDKSVINFLSAGSFMNIINWITTAFSGAAAFAAAAKPVWQTTISESAGI